MNAYKKHQDMRSGFKRAKTTTGKSCEICGNMLHGNAGSFVPHLRSHSNNKNIHPNKSETLPNGIANRYHATTAHKCSVFDRWTVIRKCYKNCITDINIM
jgi:hypothetical protein